MPLLLDIDGVPDDCCSEMLDELAKAQSFGTVDHLWDRSPNRFAADHIEAVSARLDAILQRMKEVLARFLTGHTEELRKALAPWLRWDEARFEQARNRLESMNPATMTLDDYELLVSYVIERYLPDGIIQDMAQYISVRACLLGKIESNLALDRRVTDPMIGRIVELLPTDFAHVPPRALTPLEEGMLTYGRAHAAEAIRGVSDGLRHRLNNTIMQHVQGSIMGQREGTTKHLQTALFDQFAGTNRDMRRIAVTEAGECANQAYVLNRPVGSRVKRIEAYSGACDWCRSIDGKEFEVVAADAPDKDGDREVWPGKTNVGRSAAPMKRVDDKLVERNKDEQYWPAAGLQHPNCRGGWTPVTNRPPEVSEEFFNWLQATLDRAEAGHPV